MTLVVNFKTGKLYKCSECLLIIYPTREKATVAAMMTIRAQGTPWAATARTSLDPSLVSMAASYWSKELNCTVRYSEQNEIFIFLKEEIIEEQKYLNVLFGDKQGWIVWKNWLEITKAKTNGF